MNKATLKAIESNDITAMSIYNIICLALSTGMDSAISDIVEIHINVINDCLNIIDSAWIEKQWYTPSEFMLFTLKLTLDNMKKDKTGNICLISVTGFYEDWNQAREIFK